MLGHPILSHHIVYPAWPVWAQQGCSKMDLHRVDPLVDCLLAESERCGTGLMRMQGTSEHLDKETLNVRGALDMLFEFGDDPM